MNDRTSSSYYKGEKVKLLQKGHIPTGNGGYVHTWNGTASLPATLQSDGTYLSAKIPANSAHSNICIDFDRLTDRTVAYDDALEVFIKFKNTTPHKALFVPIFSDGTAVRYQYLRASDKTNIFVSQDIGGKDTPFGGYMDGLSAEQQYRLLIPMKSAEMYKRNSINSFCIDMFSSEPSVSGSDAQVEVGDISILKNYSKETGNNVKIVAEIENVDNNKNGITLTLGNNTTNPSIGYSIDFSKNGTEACIYRNGVLLGSCVTNEESKFKDNVNRYKFAIAKTGNKIGLIAQYNDIEDGIFTLKTKEVISAIDPNPLNIRNAKFFITSSNGVQKVTSVKVLDGEDVEIPTIVKIKGYSPNEAVGLLKIYNEFGESNEREIVIPATTEVTDHFFPINDLPAFRGRITDIVITPNKTSAQQDLFIQEISLVKESETPNVITSSNGNDVIGFIKVRK